MARGVRIVNDNQFVQDIEQIFIAYNGQSREVAEGYVAAAGVVRQFYPNQTINETGIVLTAGTYTSYALAAGTAKAVCNFNAQTGQIELSDGLGVKYLQAVNPAARGQGVYLWKFDIVSGSITADDPTGVWVDANSEGTIGLKEYYLEHSTVGTAIAQATVSLAVDDGAGNPSPGTEVSITVDFTAEVSASNITMTTEPWDLNNIEVNELAEVAILTVPKGWVSQAGNVTEYGFINGEYGFPVGPVESEIYALNWSSDITVQLDVISGAVEGEVTGVPLSTAERRLWLIQAVNPGDVVTAVVDVTIAQGAESVTKRITMRAEQTSEGTDPGSEISTDFTRYDELTDTDTGTGNVQLEARVGIHVYPDGTVDAEVLNGSVPGTFPQDWNTAAPNVPDPQNYEARMVVISGDLYPISSYSSSNPTGWQNLFDHSYWVHRSTYSPSAPRGTVEKSGVWELQIRETGRPETVKTKRIGVSITLIKE